MYLIERTSLFQLYLNKTMYMVMAMNGIILPVLAIHYYYTYCSFRIKRHYIEAIEYWQSHQNTHTYEH